VPGENRQLEIAEKGLFITQFRGISEIPVDCYQVVPLLGVVSGKSHHKDAKTLRTLKKTFRRTISSAWLRDFVVKLIDTLTQQHPRGAPLSSRNVI
jgi:hypothetical protein